MNSGLVVLTGLMTVVVFAPIQFVTAQENLSPGVIAQQNDTRAAIAQINPNKPIQIRIVSRASVPVVASVLTLTGDRPIAPGKSITFGRLHTSYLSLPLNLQVSLQNTPDPTKPIRVFLDVKTVGNEIVVGVTTSLTGSGNASQTVNVDEKGSIYLY